MERLNDTIIFRMDGASSACIFLKEACSIQTIPSEKFKWHCDDGGEFEELGDYLTLQEIGDQVREMFRGHTPVLYVWVDHPLRGEIYQTGNYPGDDAWILHGETKGYA